MSFFLVATNSEILSSVFIILNRQSTTTIKSHKHGVVGELTTVITL